MYLGILQNKFICRVWTWSKKLCIVFWWLSRTCWDHKPKPNIFYSIPN